MKHLKRASLILAMVALGACSQNGLGGIGGGRNDSGASDAQGDASDPASPAYFQHLLAIACFSRWTNQRSMPRPRPH